MGRERKTKASTAVEQERGDARDGGDGQLPTSYLHKSGAGDMRKRVPSGDGI